MLNSNSAFNGGLEIWAINAENTRFRRFSTLTKNRFYPSFAEQQFGGLSRDGASGGGGSLLLGGIDLHNNNQTCGTKLSLFVLTCEVNKR